MRISDWSSDVCSSDLGKTTLLSRAVHTARVADTAVIINEFGEAGLDHVLVSQSSDADVVLLDSGCLCCASNGSLAESLETLRSEERRDGKECVSTSRARWEPLH